MNTKINKFIIYINELNFIEMKNMLNDTIEFDYSSLGLTKATVTKEQYVKLFPFLSGFEKTEHSFDVISTKENEITGKWTATHYLGDETIVVKGELTVGFTNNLISSWNLEKPSQKGDRALFLKAGKIAAEGKGRSIIQ